MAVVATRVDDVTGAPGAEPTTISVGAHRWVVDLAPASITDLLTRIGPYISAGEEITDQPPTTPADPPPSVPSSAAATALPAPGTVLTPDEAAQCRAWAQSVYRRLGLEKPPAARGRLAPSVVSAWNEAGRPEAAKPRRKAPVAA